MADKNKKRNNNRNKDYDDDFNPKFKKMKKKVCPLCGDKNFVLDFKNSDQLRKFVNDKGKILPRRTTGACAKHQRDITIAVKRARQIAAGSEVLVKTDDVAPDSIAADEIEAGKVTIC